ncbi:hypothetical protein M9458_056590 [Cirrhinus mrigala]|uniref:Uncharacterized protein n=1 Tax=Cirrhinus mrigala TaxID=683832 RepID=A0ABD0MER8_CIRMR
MPGNYEAPSQFEVLKRFYHPLVHLNSFLADNVMEELHGGVMAFNFLQLVIEMLFTEPLEDLLHVMVMFGQVPEVDEYIVDEDNYNVVEKLPEHLNHESCSIGMFHHLEGPRKQEGPWNSQRQIEGVLTSSSKTSRKPGIHGCKCSSQRQQVSKTTSRFIGWLMEADHMEQCQLVDQKIRQRQEHAYKSELIGVSKCG